MGEEDGQLDRISLLSPPEGPPETGTALKAISSSPRSSMHGFSKVALWFSDSEKQFSEALRLWAAGDTRSAIYWGRRAAKESDLAKVALAQWLVHRNDNLSVRAEALGLLRQAAESGLAEAQQVLAAWYLHGEGVPKDPSAAYEWTRQAADSGNVPCQIAMVEFLTSGQYREPDLGVATRYAELAAKAGHPEVLAALAESQAGDR